MKLTRLFPVILILAMSLQLAAAAPVPDRKLAAEIDAVMNEIYKPGEPGAAVIVRRDGRTIFRRGYGMSDLELGVKVEPDMVFRLGSITKQFTAVAVLVLAQQGKLSLRDEIGKYLPAFPIGDKKVTIEHLLTHTSGIKSYTNMEEWLQLWRKDMTPQEIIDMSKDKPFEFNPGERWNYNNTGYIMLGAIIEKVSGQTYEEFIKTKIFTPLGMDHSFYDNTERVIPRRVPGYQKGNDGFVNAPYLSMTQPYAAGSLASSVDDLALWNDTVFSGKLLKKEWQDKAFTAYRLAGGESTGYGYGWFISDLRGHRCIEHGGGINGFTSYGLYLPDDRVYVAILTNSAIEGRTPEPRALRIAELVLGLPAVERKAVTLTLNELDALVGVYENLDDEARYITREGEKLFSQRSGGAKKEILAASASEFFFADSPTVIRFTQGNQGKIDGLRFQGRIGPAEIYKRTAKPLPAARKEITLTPELLGRYSGEYEIMPGFSIIITAEAGHLMGQATGQPKLELFAESETDFFLKVVDAQMIFDLDASGKITGLTLLQGGQKLPGKKIK
ncbi:MAG TPA: serine hydrolase [Patescibacteria group bacterium]|nr:serine hydrolase [Patescibacteria group bacterium]